MSNDIENVFNAFIQQISKGEGGEIELSEEISDLLSNRELDIDMKDGGDKLILSTDNFENVHIELDKTNPLVKKLLEAYADGGELELSQEDLQEFIPNGEINVEFNTPELESNKENPEIPNLEPESFDQPSVQIGVDINKTPTEQNNLSQLFSNGERSCDNLVALLSFVTEHTFSNSVDEKCQTFEEANQHIKRLRREFVELKRLFG